MQPGIPSKPGWSAAARLLNVYSTRSGKSMLRLSLVSTPPASRHEIRLQYPETKRVSAEYALLTTQKRRSYNEATAPPIRFATHSEQDRSERSQKGNIACFKGYNWAYENGNKVLLCLLELFVTKIFTNNLDLLYRNLDASCI
jgi:hypothetical protein